MILTSWFFILSQFDQYTIRGREIDKRRYHTLLPPPSFSFFPQATRRKTNQIMIQRDTKSTHCDVVTQNSVVGSSETEELMTIIHRKFRRQTSAVELDNHTMHEFCFVYDRWCIRLVTGVFSERSI